MSVQKKVTLLLILLIALIVSCVYKHTNGFDFSTNNVIEPLVKKEKNDTNDTEKISSTLNDTKISKSNDTLSESKEENKEILDTPKSSESLNTLNENTSENTTLNEEEKAKDLKNKTLEKEVIEENKEVKELKEEVKEDKKEKIPLLITDKRYKRTSDEKRIEELSLATQKLQLKINDYIKNNPIIFKRGSNIITKKSLEVIDEIASILKDNPNIKIEVAGHTDAAGKNDLNKRISVYRAVTVKNKLIELGINKSRIKARGYGENIPLVKNSIGGYSNINRRVEFNIVGE